MATCSICRGGATTPALSAGAGHSSEFGGYRFERPIDASALALGPQNGPECCVSLRWNERKFLSLTTI